MKSLSEILSSHRKQIVKLWFDKTAETYPGDVEKFLKKKENEFANPIGSSMHDSLGPIMDSLLTEGELDFEPLKPTLERIMKVRAIQEFSAAQATGFFLYLKDISRKILKDNDYKPESFQEILEFESKIDDLLLLSFNMYSECKKKIYELRAVEIKNNNSQLLKHAYKIWDKGRINKDDESTNSDNGEIGINPSDERGDGG